MKKTVIAASAMLLAASAFASSIAVPFFVDWPGIGTRGFIGLKNNTGEDIELSLFYRDLLGQNRTPGDILGNLGATFVDQLGNQFPPGTYRSDPDNTYLLRANAAITWRPCTNGGGEGVGSQVPNMMGFLEIQPGTTNTVIADVAGEPGGHNPWNGSIEIRWSTVNDERDIQGRYNQDSGSQTSFRSEYLLPPGGGAN